MASTPWAAHGEPYWAPPGITTDYAAISYSSTPQTSRYVRRDEKIIGAVQRAHDGTWIALNVAQILDRGGCIAEGLPDMNAAIAAVVAA